MPTTNKPRSIVQGTVTDRSSKKLPNLLVKAFDQDMRSEKFVTRTL